MDWACDEILQHTINYLNKEHVPATFMITHNTPLLQQLRNNPAFELGIHPNFQKLLNGNLMNENMESVIKKILAIVPEAKSVRCHSLVTSSPLLALFKKHGLKYELNDFIPFDSGINLQPYMHFCNHIIKYTIFF